MAGRSVFSSNKETTAVKMNLKEARVLTKSVQTLSLEEAYQSKLLDIDKKMVKFNYGRLKRNVSRIKSHLRSGDISHLKDLDDQGKFRAEHPMSCSSTNSTKISAAQRRLKLGTYRRAQSAMPKLNSESRKDSPGGAEAASVEHKQIACTKKVRPKTTVCASRRSSEDVGEPDERKTISPRPKSSAFLLERISKAQKAHKEVAPQSSYSCHEEKLNPTSEQKKSFGLDTFELNPYEERRRKLLHMEDAAFESLKDKKSEFVCHLDTFVQENPSLIGIRPEDTEQVISSIDSMASRPGTKAQQCALSESGQRALFEQLADIRRLNAVCSDESSADGSMIDTHALHFRYKMKLWRQYDSASLSLHYTG